MGMNILELKAADLGGAIAHVAATQLYMAMTDDDEEVGPRTWFGSDPADDAGIEKDVLDMASYINGRDIPAEQLWRWGMIEGIVVRDVEEFRALPTARRLAFEIFTDTCMRAHHRLELAQLDAQKLIPLAEVPTPGLKLEDSIFEPHGSLADQEDYQKQWLADQDAADRRRLEEQIAKAAEEAAGESQSLGKPIDDQDEKPAGLSAGVKEGAGDETEVAGEGQEPSGAPSADMSAQGSVPEMADDGLPATGGDDGDGSEGGAAGDAAGGAELADPVAQPAGDEAGADGAADGAHAAVESEARIGGENIAADTKKSRKGKSTS